MGQPAAELVQRLGVVDCPLGIIALMLRGGDTHGLSMALIDASAIRALPAMQDKVG